MQTEALTTMAYFLHSKIIMRLGAESTDEIPANCNLTACKKDLQDMWTLLETCCSLDYVSRFLITQAQQALKTGSWKLSQTVKRILIGLKVEATRRDLEYKKLHPNSQTNPYIDNVLNFSAKRSFLSLEHLLNTGVFDCECQLNCGCQGCLNDMARSGVTKNDLKSIKTQEHRKKFNAGTYDNMLSSVRTGLLSGKMSIEDLVKRGDLKRQIPNYQAAISFYTLAADRLQTLKINIFEMDQATQIKLANIMASRARCHLKIGELRQDKEFIKLAEIDTKFVLYDDVFNEGFIKGNKELHDQLCDTNLMCEVFYIKHESDAVNVVQQNNNRRPKGKSVDLKKIDAAKIDVALSNDSEKLTGALNGDDRCPICLETWPEIVAPSITAILPCEHACCAKCLHVMQKKCNELNENDESTLFSCSLCRYELKPIIVKEIARTVVKQNLIDSFTELGRHLSLNKEKRDKLVISLLVSRLYIPNLLLIFQILKC